jgi:hypothetical protein
MAHDALLYLDWDTACLHCSKILGDDDEAEAHLRGWDAA